MPTTISGTNVRIAPAAIQEKPLPERRTWRNRLPDFSPTHARNKTMPISLNARFAPGARFQQRPAVHVDDPRLWVCCPPTLPPASPRRLIPRQKENLQIAAALDHLLRTRRLPA